MLIQRNAILWTKEQIDERVSGEWLAGRHEEWFATGVTREPSRVASGDLFITAGPVGEEFVANTVNQLFARGAVAVITRVRPDTTDLWGPVLVVEDTLPVYESLAAAAIDRSRATIIGVTGSVGKTGTKDALAHALSHQASVISSPGSANSDTVVLNVLSQLPPVADYAVVEVGMLGPASMKRRALLCRPRVALITTIGSSHRGHHQSDFSIAQTKADLIDGLVEGGTAVLPRDSAFFDYLRGRAEETENAERIVSFGRHNDADVRLISQRLHANHSDVEAECLGTRLTYRTGIPGEHHVDNSLAVLAVVAAAGADVEQAAATLATLTPSVRRGQRFRVMLPVGVCEVVDDSWNASPQSVAAAIRTFSLRPVADGGRRIAALGDMLELGTDEVHMHRELATVIESSNISVVHTAGPLMEELHKVLPTQIRGRHFPDSKEMSSDLDRIVKPGDSLLVKGSNATEMSRVVRAALGEQTREDCVASRYWDLGVEANGIGGGGDSRQRHSIAVTEPESAFLETLRQWLADTEAEVIDPAKLKELLVPSNLPTDFWGFAVTLYQPGVDRLMVVRAAQTSGVKSVQLVLQQFPKHPRFGEFDLGDRQQCRMQVDFIVEEPQPADPTAFSESTLPQTQTSGPATSDSANVVSVDQDFGMPAQMLVVSLLPDIKPLTRFEVGVDGLRIVAEDKRRYILPGDAFVRSFLGMGQLQRYIQRLFPDIPFEDLTFYRFRSLSFVSDVDTDSPNWIPLYRGLPPVSTATDETLKTAARAGTEWIVDNFQNDGRFTYYYDSASDTQRDHEHPKRDPVTDPYYNLLRHSGGTITLLLDAQMHQMEAGRTEAGDSPGSVLQTLKYQQTIEQSIQFFCKQLVEYQTAGGTGAAYALYNRKAKLGGSGIGLYSLALYQRLTHSDRFAIPAQQLAQHLISEISDDGEFRYYHIYLDRPVTWEDNQRYFSFYYPGEAVLGLSHYSQHVCRSADERGQIHQRLHEALRFLLRKRPELHREHYKSLPADSWLMMGINDLWEVPEFQVDEYRAFVFDDADQMVQQMYTADNALYPDYVGSFFYDYGDHPYPDGARAEGLLAALQLALKVGDSERISRYRDACQSLATALLRLCNTPDSVYSAKNPKRAAGGIRFKLTRQWFRVDTIQHVASFYLKLLMTDLQTEPSHVPS